MIDSDAASSSRILIHMNADHHDSLARYLQHFCHLPASQAQTAELEDVTLSHMIIKSTGRRNIVYFTPPLQKWSEARARVVEMDQEAREGLGESDIVVTRYTPPKGFHLLVFVTCLATYVGFARRGNFEPGSILHDGVLERLPRFNAFCWHIQPWLLAFMVGIHATEAFFFERKKLQRYGVKRFGSLWWTWMVSVFIEGFGAFQRVEALARAQHISRGGKKH